MTTQADLDQLARIINNFLEAGANNPRQVVVQYAYGQPRLVTNGGSIDVSPRLPKKQLEDWMRAYYSGLIDGHAQATQAATRAQEG